MPNLTIGGKMVFSGKELKQQDHDIVYDGLSKLRVNCTFRLPSDLRRRIS